jgi:hypothetical protein
MKQPFKIYRDPMPEPVRRRRSTSSFGRMKVGECTYAPMTDSQSPNALASSARRWTRRNGKDWRFIIRIKDDLVGIWRVK